MGESCSYGDRIQSFGGEEMSEEFERTICPMCGTPCTIEGKVGSTQYYVPILFTREEIERIRYMLAERWPRRKKLSAIDQSMVEKCDAILKGAAE